MDEVNPFREYTIFQKDILIRLENRRWFIDCIGFNYSNLAERWQCSTVLSERRLGEAFDFWKEDQIRTLTEGIQTGSSSLDHFKHASFIGFWLRRMLPINTTLLISTYKVVPEEDGATEDQQFFLRYGNELCAFLIGFQLCLFYESSIIFDGDNVVYLRPEKRIEYLKKCMISTITISDFVMILKHKNMSPHALYLLYKSLFTTITPGPR